MLLASEIYNFHRLELTRQVGFIVTVYDEDGFKLAATNPCSTPAEAFAKREKLSITKSRVQENNRLPLGDGPRGNCSEVI
jgi:hypothetical protein